MKEAARRRAREDGHAGRGRASDYEGGTLHRGGGRYCLRSHYSTTQLAYPAADPSCRWPILLAIGWHNYGSPMQPSCAELRAAAPPGRANPAELGRSPDPRVLKRADLLPEHRCPPRLSQCHPPALLRDCTRGIRPRVRPWVQLRIEVTSWFGWQATDWRSAGWPTYCRLCPVAAEWAGAVPREGGRGATPQQGGGGESARGKTDPWGQLSSWEPHRDSESKPVNKGSGPVTARRWAPNPWAMPRRRRCRRRRAATGSPSTWTCPRTGLEQFRPRANRSKSFQPALDILNCCKLN
jgi:hypothetical protein